MKAPPQIAQAVARYTGKHQDVRALMMRSWGYYEYAVNGQWAKCTTEERDEARAKLKDWAWGYEREEALAV